MNDRQWEVVRKALDGVQAEILRGLLEAQGITVHISREGYQSAYGLTSFPLTNIEILVPAEQAEKAAKILADYDSGKFVTKGKG